MSEEKDGRFKNLELKIGVMVVCAVAGIILVIVSIGIQKDLFTKKYDLYFLSTSGVGFKVGMPVKLSGFKIGRIKTIELTEGAKVKVVAEVNKKYENWLRAGARATTGKEGLFGEPFIEIAMGEAKGRPLTDGENIPYDKTGGFEELAEEARPILNEVKEIIHYVNSPDGDFKKSFGNIREFTAELRQTRARLDGAIKDADETIKRTGQLVSDVNTRTALMLDSAGKAAKNLETFSLSLEPVAGRLPGVVEKLDNAAQDVKSLTGSLSKEGPRIGRVIANAEDASAEAGRLVKGINESWPGRLVAPEAKTPALVPLDGYVFRKMARGETKSR
ncbi:MAG: MCE family protein [Deltaproteobacteria bacterium]|nr:MCE family protein [Deltaproteobacteria bacterium]